MRQKLKNFISRDIKIKEDVLASDVFSLIRPEMRKMQNWIAHNTEPLLPIENTISGKIWKEIPGGHKWLDYFDIYEKEFSRLRHQQPKILEIGVYKGASLNLWRKYFGDGATIVGIDIDPNCLSHHAPENGIFVEIGSQDDSAFLQNIISKYGPFDLIIDDGSHISSHQIASFNALFLDGIKSDGGLYFVEDLECIYWGNTVEYRDGKISSVDFFKMLIDIQNGIFSTYTYNDFALHTGTALDCFVAPLIAHHIAGVRFYRGIVVVEKKLQVPPRTLHI